MEYYNKCSPLSLKFPLKEPPSLAPLLARPNMWKKFSTHYGKEKLISSSSKLINFDPIISFTLLSKCICLRPWHLISTTDPTKCNQASKLFDFSITKILHDIIFPYLQFNPSEWVKKESRRLESGRATLSDPLFSALVTY